MLKIGETILLALVSGYNPAVYVGRVVQVYGDGGEIADAVMVPHCHNGEWGLLARGDAAVRANSKFRLAGNIRFPTYRDARPWIGEIPAPNDN